MIVLTVVYVGAHRIHVHRQLKPNREVLDGLNGFKPTNLSFDNYTGVVGRFDDDASGYFWQFYLTSAIVSFVVVIGGLLINSMLGYALARLRWKGRNFALLMVVLLVIVPFEAIAVPLYYMLQGYRNTYFVQFIPFVASAFSVYLFYSFFAGMPKQLEESARIDGASAFKTFILIIVPDVEAGVRDGHDPDLPLVVGFVPVAGDDHRRPAVRPLPLEISVFQGQPPLDWGQIFAFGVLLVLPVLLVFLLFQRWFVESVASSGLKG